MAKKFRRMKHRSGFFSRKSHSKSSSGLTPVNVMLAGAIYGAARPYLANIIPDFFSFGGVDSDNVIIGATAYYGMKKGGFWKALGTVALASEVGIVTSRIVSGQGSNMSANGNYVTGYQ